ncbi:MAG: rod shape-determining protein MreC [Tissierellia bacterium]|nr:rod shape-determining protein MreC [Tissierellia bacterium]
MNMRRGGWIKWMFTAFVLVLLVFIFVKPIQNPKNPVSNLLAKVINPVSGFFRDAGLSIRGTVSQWFHPETEDQLERLKLEIAALKDENRKLLNIVQQSEVLEREYAMLEQQNTELIEGKIVARDPGNWFDLFTINIGSNQGVALNDTVVVAVEGDRRQVVEGLVGKITQVHDDYSTVTTIHDDSIKVSARSLRTREGAVMTGVKSGNLEGYMFDRNADIIVGDKMITSGLGEVFKEGIYLGEVVEVISDDSMMKKIIHVKPLVTVKQLQKVYVVK